MRRVQCVISGSYRKFMPRVKAKMEECRRSGVEVLSPHSADVQRVDDGFVYLKGESGNPREIELAHLNAIARCDFLYVVNPSGYVGPSGFVEIGFAGAHAVPVFCEEPPTELVARQMVEVTPSIESIKASVLREELPEITRGSSLSQLQAYIRRMVRVRGFQDESIRDVVLLLMEEIGELAKAVRTETGLMTDLSLPGSRKMIAHELADCLIYLLDVANLSSTNLELALIEKEGINEKKKWKKEQ